MMIHQTNQLNKHIMNYSTRECRTPTCEELNYETSQVKCPHRENNTSGEKCQKIFKNIMALNVHLQMYHKEIGILTAFNKYISYVGRFHCPIKNCTFHRCYGQCSFLPWSSSSSSSFSSFNAVRLHYLRQHGLKKEQCSKCSKSFGLHQDFIAHERICGIQCPFSCSKCHEQFHNRTSLRRHQLKFHTDSNRTSPVINSSSLLKPKEYRKRLNRRRPLSSDQIELSRQIIPSTPHSSVIINPHALALLKTFKSDSTSRSSTIDSSVTFESTNNKSTQTTSYVSVGTECCSFALSQSISMKVTEQKSSQTMNHSRMCKKRTRYSLSSSNHSNTSQWKNIHVIDMETQIASPLRSDMSIQTINIASDSLDFLPKSPENHHNVITQTLPISMTSTEMQTINEISNQCNNLNNFPEQESVGTSCFFDDFLLNDLTSSVFSDLNVIDLFDFIDNGTQTYSTLTNHETQTVADWNDIVIPEDECIQTIMNT
ncbi:hypothetical protein I4U23_009681 [Adineta vaga]|nr:hypothetical protein I4U23_009681 [Adineta vaga]